MELKRKFGQRLKELRKSNNWTQEQLAEIVGVDTKHISFLETGRNFPSSDLLEKFKKVFNIDYQDIFNFAQSENKQSYIDKIDSILVDMDMRQVDFIYKMILEIKCKL